MRKEGLGDELVTRIDRRSYLGQLDLVLAESGTPEVDMKVAVARPQAVDSLGVLVENVAPLAPPPLVTVELVTEPVS